MSHSEPVLSYKIEGILTRKFSARVEQLTLIALTHINSDTNAIPWTFKFIWKVFGIKFETNQPCTDKFK